MSEPFNEYARRALFEEALAGLFLTAAGVMFLSGHSFFGWACVLKAGLDTLGSIVFWSKKNKLARETPK